MPIATRSQLVKAYNAALEAVEPAGAVRRVLRTQGNSFDVAGEQIEVTGAVRVAAFGKAAPAMAWGAIDVLGDRVLEGVVVSERDEPTPEPLQGLKGEHPFPGAGSLAAGEAILSMARRCGDQDLLLVLVSGGASSLAEVPVDQLSIDECAELQRSLFAAGTPIEDLNRVRRHISKLKNGGLLRAANGASVVTLLVSDVAGAPASTIGSGPTLADKSTWDDAERVLSARLGDHSFAQPRPTFAEASVRRHRWRVIADGAQAARAAQLSLAAQSVVARVVTTNLHGEARDAAVRLMRGAESGVSIVSGETTVTGATIGRGGRNMEAALAVACSVCDGLGWVFGALSTDGIDGPTDAAGAIVDESTLSRGRAIGLEARELLDRHDSYPFLKATGDLVITGPSGTNVGDLWMLALE